MTSDLTGSPPARMAFLSLCLVELREPVLYNCHMGLSWIRVFLEEEGAVTVIPEGADTEYGLMTALASSWGTKSIEGDLGSAFHCLPSRLGMLAGQAEFRLLLKDQIWVQVAKGMP